MNSREKKNLGLHLNLDSFHLRENIHWFLQNYIAGDAILSQTPLVEGVAVSSSRLPHREQGSAANKDIFNHRNLVQLHPQVRSGVR